MRRDEHADVQAHDQDTQFGRAAPEERQAKDAGHVVVDEDVDAKEEIADQGEQSSGHRHVAGEAQPRHDQEVAKRIDGVIEEIAVDRALDMAVACEAAVERIAEPVDRQPERSHPKKGRVASAEDVAREDDDRADDREGRESVGGHEGRQTCTKPIEELTLTPRDDVALDARHTKGLVRHALHHRCHPKIERHEAHPGGSRQRRSVGHDPRAGRPVYSAPLSSRCSLILHCEKRVCWKASRAYVAWSLQLRGLVRAYLYNSSTFPVPAGPSGAPFKFK